MMNEIKLGGSDGSNWSKFKKVEMLSGTDLDSWLFRANRYFQIRMLADSEKMTKVVTNFNRATLDWYRSQ